MPYVQRKFYFSEEMYVELTMLARAARQPITQVLREVVAEGLTRRRRERGGEGARALLALAKRAERERWGRGAPRDLSTNHNKYFVQAYEKLKEGKHRRRP